MVVTAIEMHSNSTASQHPDRALVSDHVLHKHTRAHTHTHAHARIHRLRHRHAQRQRETHGHAHGHRHRHRHTHIQADEAFMDDVPANVSMFTCTRGTDPVLSTTGSLPRTSPTDAAPVTSVVSSPFPGAETDGGAGSTTSVAPSTNSSCSAVCDSIDVASAQTVFVVNMRLGWR